MGWYIFFGLFGLVNIIPFIAFSVKHKTDNTKDDDIFSRVNTSIYKGFAIICVVLCHYMGYYGDGVVLFTPFGGIGVSIFLLLSGFGLNESWNCKKIKTNSSNTEIHPYSYWWRKRIISVIIPYSIIQFCFYWIPLWVKNGFELSDLVPMFLDFLCIFPKYSMGWYLQYLMLWYIIFYCIRRISFLNNYRFVVFLIIGILLFFCLQVIRAEQAFSFPLGVILSDNKKSKYVTKSYELKYGFIYIIIGICFLALKQLSIIRSGPDNIYKMIQLGIKLPIGFGCMILIWYISKKIDLAFFSYVGVVSYEVYIIHGNVFGYFSKSIYGSFLFLLFTAIISTVYWYIMSKSKKIQKKILRINE